MWNDFVTWFNDKASIAKDWTNDTEKLIYAILPLAAFVYFVVMMLKKRSRNKRPPEE
jgi:hypothetical protein